MTSSIPPSGCPAVRTVWRFALRLNRLEGRRTLPCALLASALLLGSCARDGSSSATASAPAPEEPLLDLGGEAPWPAAYSGDPLWVRAAAGDDLDRARLARRESAASLLAAVRSGGSLGRVALSALVYASDRHAERGALCELCAHAEPSSRALLLDALFDTVINAAPTEETGDPGADARCTLVLEALVQGEDVTVAERDRAAVLLGRLRAP
jgi:hypothetical protein